MTALCLGFLLVAIGGADNAQAEPFKYTVSGTPISTTIDTNDDGSTATNAHAEGKSTLGPISVQGLSEGVLQLPLVFCALPDGSPGIQSEAILATPVFQVRGQDLLTAELVEGTSCFSLATCFAMGQLQPGCSLSTTTSLQFTGGTGKFSGASGSFEFASISEVLVVSPTGNFATFVSEAEGEIHVPLAE